jgi:signal transduction histidine kinase
MLNTTLDVAEAEAGALRIQRKEIDVRQIAAEMADLYQPAAEERSLTIEVTGSARAIARVDPELIRRALANLLDNAVQYLPPGRHVRISAVSTEGRLALSVADDGPGFPEPLRGRVFERFARGPASKGFGIGLALVRAAALAHGGEAAVLEVSGGGACVAIDIPTQINNS